MSHGCSLSSILNLLLQSVNLKWGIAKSQKSKILSELGLNSVCIYSKNWVFLQLLVPSEVFWRPIFPNIFWGLRPLAPCEGHCPRADLLGVQPQDISSNPQRNLQPLRKKSYPQKCPFLPTEGIIFQNFSPAAGFYSILIMKMSLIL